MQGAYLLISRMVYHLNTHIITYLTYLEQNRLLLQQGLNSLEESFLLPLHIAWGSGGPRALRCPGTRDTRAKRCPGTRGPRPQFYEIIYNSYYI